MTGPGEFCGFIGTAIVLAESATTLKRQEMLFEIIGHLMRPFRDPVNGHESPRIARIVDCYFACASATFSCKFANYWALPGCL
jgi:hypothetical protein